MRRVVFALLAGLTLQAQAPAQRPSPAPAGNAEEGKKLFVSDGCYQCHGYEAQGSNATGPRLGPRPIVFAAFGPQGLLDRMARKNVETFIEGIKSGIEALKV